MWDTIIIPFPNNNGAAIGHSNRKYSNVQVSHPAILGYLEKISEWIYMNSISIDDLVDDEMVERTNVKQIFNTHGPFDAFKIAILSRVLLIVIYIYIYIYIYKCRATLRK